MPQGFNNWREKMWAVILVATILVGVGYLAGLVAFETFNALTIIVVGGFTLHVIWLNFYIKPRWWP